MVAYKRSLALALALLIACASLPWSVAAEAVTEETTPVISAGSDETTAPAEELDATEETVVATEDATVPQEEATVPTDDDAFVKSEATTQSPAVGATCGKNLEYTLTDGVLTISGSGAMTEFKQSGAPWYKKAASIEEVVIKKGVTNIARYAFMDCVALTKVTIPSTVTEIGVSAFYNCTSLATIKIPDNVKRIGDQAFMLSGLTSVAISAGTIDISPDAFSACNHLTGFSVDSGNAYYSSDPAGVLFDKNKWTLIHAPGAISGSYEIPGTVEMIGYSAFEGCAGLTEVVIPESVIEIDMKAFYGSGLTSVTIPDSVKYINKWAFYGCNALTAVSIPDSVVSVGMHAFEACENLKYNIYEGVKYLGNSDCAYLVLVSPESDSIAQIAIPGETKLISGGAFDACVELTGFLVDETNAYWSSDDCGVLFDKEKTLLRKAPNKLAGKYTVPKGVEKIEGSSFYRCFGLTQVTIPGSVQSIYYSAFEECTGLTGVTFSEGIMEIEDNAFYGCKSLKTVTLPSTVYYIGFNAFAGCTELVSASLPSGLFAISIGTFRGCKALAEVTIPKSMRLIGEHAFYECNSLKTVYYDGSSSSWGEIRIEKNNDSLNKADIISTVRGTKLSPPAIEIGLNDTGNPTLSWNAVADASYYAVYRANSKTGSYTKVAANVSSTSWTDNKPTVGKTHYYKVIAVFADNTKLNSGYSNIVSQAIKCAKPKISVAIKSGKPYISWSGISGATKYEIQYSTDGKSYKKLTTTTKTSYTHSKASTGSQHFYKVKAVASATTYNSSFSTVKSCAISCDKPSVTISNHASKGYPVLTWKAVTGAKRYDVYRRLAGKGKYEKIGDTTGKTYTDKKAAVNTKYDYKVQAIGKQTELNSSMSSKDTILCKLAVPVITVKTNDKGKPVISWEAVKGAKSYKVYRSTKATKSYKKHTGGKLDVKKGTYTDTTVAFGKTYYYKVVAVGEDNKSAYSDYKKATGKCGVPKVTATKSANKPVLKWKKISGAKKYEIQYSTDGKTFKKLTTTTKTSYTHKAKAGYTYYYRIKALGSKSSYNGNFSAVTAGIAVSCSAPSVKVTVDKATGKPTLTWKKVTGAKSYAIYRTAKGVTDKPVTVKGLTYKDTTAKPGVKYSYRVVACGKKDAYNSAKSKALSVTATYARPTVKGKIGGTGKPALTWTPVQGATKYLVYRSTSKSKLGSKVATVKATGKETKDFTYTYKKAKKKKTYYYSIIAVKGSLKSASSTPIKLIAKK